MAKSKKLADVDGYISQFPAEVQKILQQIRNTVRRSAPDATETLSYNMPAYRQNGVLVYFAAWKKHVGFYPPITGHKTLEKRAAGFAGPKGNLIFPLDQPIPHDLIARIVKLRLKQDLSQEPEHRQLAVCSHHPGEHLPHCR